MNEDKVAVLRQCCLEPLVAMSDSAASDSAYFLSRNREYFSNSQLFLATMTLPVTRRKCLR